MFRKLDDFLKAYDQLTEGTNRIFGALTDANLKQRVAEGHRALGQIAWHIVTSLPEMMNRTGLGLGSVDSESAPPASAAEIAAAYKRASTELRDAVRKNWTDETLLQVDDMYGMQWPRGVTLSALLSHETHHRGQMTVLLRQAGAKVPGVMGPAREEWGQYGMEPPPY
jgi:uncharacterized damage-inducible protein DinB